MSVNPLHRFPVPSVVPIKPMNRTRNTNVEMNAVKSKLKIPEPIQIAKRIYNETSFKLSLKHSLNQINQSTFW